MRSLPVGRLLVLALAMGAAAIASGCAPSPGASSGSAGSLEPLAYSVCPPSGEADAAATAAAIDVLRSRLAWLEAAGTVGATGTCIDVAVPAPDAAVVAAVEGTGSVRLLALPADRFGEAAVGGAVPPDPVILAAPGDITGSGTRTGADGRPELVLRLAPDATRALQAFTGTGLGGGLVLDVDGVVIATQAISGPIAGPDVVLSFAAEPTVPLRALLAMLVSGPLPEAWTQPRNPQG